MKTQKEIDAQIQRLKDVRPKVRPFSFFGTDNLECLDAMVRVLEQDMDSDDIWDRWDRDEEDFDVRSNADGALKWREGESEEDDLAQGFPLLK